MLITNAGIPFFAALLLLSQASSQECKTLLVANNSGRELVKVTLGTKMSAKLMPAFDQDYKIQSMAWKPETDELYAIVKSEQNYKKFLAELDPDDGSITSLSETGLDAWSVLAIDPLGEAWVYQQSDESLYEMNMDNPLELKKIGFTDTVRSMTSSGPVHTLFAITKNYTHSRTPPWYLKTIATENAKVTVLGNVNVHNVGGLKFIKGFEDSAYLLPKKRTDGGRQPLYKIPIEKNPQAETLYENLPVKKPSDFVFYC